MKKLIISLMFMTGAILASAHVLLLYPVGGESFQAGQEIEIEWEILVMHDTENWDLYFSTDGGNTWEVIEEDLPADQLSYTWIVPDVSTEEGRVRVVQDNVGTDYSDESDNFSVTGTTGIISITDPELDLKVYPNPAHEYLYVASEEDMSSTVVRILDLSGRLIESELAMIRASEPYRLNLQGIRPGIYQIQLITDKKKTARKIIIE